MKKICLIMFLVVLTGIYGFSASMVLTKSTHENNSKVVKEGEWVYSGRASYQGVNYAKANGNKTGRGYMQLTEIIPHKPNSAVCIAKGAMGIPNETDLTCHGSSDNKNNQIETQSKYTNLTGTATLSAGIYN